MDPNAIYGLLRAEILDQRKCQFQMYTLAAGLASASLVFAEKSGLGALVFMAPLIFNAAALIMIVVKELSIFRKVAYLQLLEQNESGRRWRWESDLDAFRTDQGVYPPFRKSHNHTYPLLLCTFVNLLNLFSLALYFFSRFSAESLQLLAPRSHGVVDGVAIALALFALAYTATQFRQLVSGRNCTAAMLAKWRQVLRLPAVSEAAALDVPRQ